MAHKEFITHQYCSDFLHKGDGRDFEWLKKAQNEKYKKAFELTKDFLKEIESTAFSVSLEHSKIPSLTGNSLLWMIIIPINIAVISVQIYDWGNLNADVGHYTLWIFFLTFLCAVIEMTSYMISSPTEGNINLINRLKTQWEFVINNDLSQEEAFEQIELFIVLERTINYRKLMKAPLGNILYKYLPVGIQFIMTAAIVTLAGNILHDKNIVDKNEEKKVLVCSAENWKDDSPRITCKKQVLPK